MARLRELRIPGVAGNYDSTVATGYQHCGCNYEDERQEELSHLSYEWTKAHTSEDTKQYLAGLPFRLDVRPQGGHRATPTLFLVHGTPTLNTVYWTYDRSDAFCLQMAALAGARAGDVIAFGHTHLPWSRTIGGIRFVNTGSVGRPKDGDWRAGYVIVDFSGGPPKIELVRVQYAIERTVRAILDSDLPDAFAWYLRSGGKALDSGAVEEAGE